VVVVLLPLPLRAVVQAQALALVQVQVQVADTLAVAPEQLLEEEAPVLEAAPAIEQQKDPALLSS